MRDNMAGIFAAFAVIFIVYIVLDWGMDITGRKHREQSDVIGSVDGVDIHYQEFADLVRQEIDNQRQQTGKEIDPQQEAQIREQVWNMLVNRILMEKEAKRLGIEVTNQEIVDWVRGPNPPDFLVRIFTDSTGKFNREAYERALNNPQFKNEWVQIEQNLRLMRLQQKLESALMASAIITPEAVRQSFLDRDTKLNAQYVFLNPSQLFNDTGVTVTEDELRRYYDDHAFEYKQEATRRLKIVTFPEVPSSQDTLDALHEAKNIIARVNSGGDFLELAKEYSETPVTDTLWFNLGSISTAKQDSVATASVGAVLGPILDYDGVHVIKVLGERQGKEEFIQASHILLRPSGSDSAAVKQRAREIAAEARRGSEFSELARKYSQDPGSAQRGGNLGWFGKGRMVKAFEEAAFKGRIGEIIGPVETPFGFHIIKVTGRSRTEYRLADIVLRVMMSSQTRQDISQRASDFAYVARQDGFDKAAKSLGYQVRETPPFTEKGIIPGIGLEPEISRFAFGGKPGKISDPFTIRNAYVVCEISEAKEAGVKPYSEVKDQVKSAVIFEKKMAKTKKYAEELRGQLGTSNELALVPTIDPRLRLDSTGVITPLSAVEGVPGRDERFVGSLMVIPLNVVPNPIRGDRGYYLVKLLMRTPYDSSAYASQSNMLREQLLQSAKATFLNAWLDNVKEKANIIDNRDKFFRE